MGDLRTNSRFPGESRKLALVARQQKVKCHDQKPCRRCRKQGLRCGPTLAQPASPGPLRSHATVEPMQQSSIDLISALHLCYHSCKVHLFPTMVQWLRFTPAHRSLALPSPMDIGMTDEISYCLNSIVQEDHQSQYYPAISDTAPLICARTSQQGLAFMHKMMIRSLLYSSLQSLRLVLVMTGKT